MRRSLYEDSRERRAEVMAFHAQLAEVRGVGLPQLPSAREGVARSLDQDVAIGERTLDVVHLPESDRLDGALQGPLNLQPNSVKRLCPWGHQGDSRIG